ncbi:MAG TPA: hypothetical protein VKT33_09780 [Candidatus Angelobacter sp.]|nr:hypothetical protein [Candidatus Angelobacter sp.]
MVCTRAEITTPRKSNRALEVFFGLFKAPATRPNIAPLMDIMLKLVIIEPSNGRGALFCGRSNYAVGVLEDGVIKLVDYSYF